jgi:proline dehydrogenase
MDFKNTEVAYRHLSNAEILRALTLFKTIQLESLTLLGTQLLRGMMKLRLPVGWAIKPTIFRHFVGGESVEQCRELIDKQYGFGVKTVLDYSVEGQKTEESFDHALAHFKRSITYISQKKEKIPFCVFKPSALGEFNLAKIAQEEGRLTDDETEKLDVFASRVRELCEFAEANDVPILVDAEESWVQSYYDDMVWDMQQKLNKSKAIVFNTFQMYRVGKLEQLESELQACRKQGVTFGVKLVRGAYMEKEREFAKDNGHPSPIHASKKDTDDCFNQAIELCFDYIDCCSMVIGSHNEFSNRLAAEKMKKIGMNSDDSRVYFSQLFGMADHISYNMAAIGYNVAKYVPYGPVKDVLPYLFRRAEENSSVQGQAPLECKLLAEELKRRNKKD